MSSVRTFPEVYTNGDRPAKCRVRDKDRQFLTTPAYAYGWIVSIAELYVALGYGEEAPKTCLVYFFDAVNDRLYARWKTIGFNYEYNPIRPEVETIGEDHILIYMACNSSTEVMDSIMANKSYHQECRECLNISKTMMLEPAWFRVGLKGMPKGFIPDNQEDTSK